MTWLLIGREKVKTAIFFQGHATPRPFDSRGKKPVAYAHELFFNFLPNPVVSLRYSSQA